jgi:hypothetical protein
MTMTLAPGAALQSTVDDLARSASPSITRIEQVLRTLARDWNPQLRWSVAYELDEVFTPGGSLRENARQFYRVLPDAPLLPRPHRGFIAIGLAYAMAGADA